MVGFGVVGRGCAGSVWLYVGECVRCLDGLDAERTRGLKKRCDLELASASGMSKGRTDDHYQVSKDAKDGKAPWRTKRNNPYTLYVVVLTKKPVMRQPPSQWRCRWQVPWHARGFAASDASIPRLVPVA